jgi:hypothetical protein
LAAQVAPGSRVPGPSLTLLFELLPVALLLEPRLFALSFALLPVQQCRL